ncbi:glucoside xylosyltransferase 1-like isoform X2 [Haliotis cracherodii]|uniref:glucoside xylosyltransferase 1-like isoform X2 n=1 Tax=Haliotis cracherodii TaxID=6455 RepID=UPI0039EBB1CF
MYRPSRKRCLVILPTLAIINGLLWSFYQAAYSQGDPLSTHKLQTHRRIGYQHEKDTPIGLDLIGLKGIKRRTDKTLFETKTASVFSIKSTKVVSQVTSEPLPQPMRMSDSDQTVAEKYLGTFDTAPRFSIIGSPGTSDNLPQSTSPEGMHLAIAMCGNRIEEVKVLVKSVMLFTRHATIHVFSDPPSQKPLCEHIKSLPGEYRKQFTYHIYNITLPRGKDAETWSKLYGPCAAQRLFIPYILQRVNKLIYVDTDVIFLSPMEKLWGQFSRFNKSHIAALIPEHRDPSFGWYNRVANIPYYGKLGLNSGVMLMDLVRLREDQWLDKMMNYFKKYLSKLILGDQDLINIFFHFEPEKLYKCSCEWNYRADHCQFPSTRSRCPPALKDGAYTLHGNSQRFHGPKYPALSAVYTAFQSHRLGLDTKTALLESIKTRLKDARSSCARMPEAFYKQIEVHINTPSVPH